MRNPMSLCAVALSLALTSPAYSAPGLTFNRPDWKVVAVSFPTASLDAAVKLGDLLRRADRLDEAAAVLANFAHELAAKTVLARVGLQRRGVSLDGDLDATLERLLEASSGEGDAKDHLLEMLDALGPEDPRYVSYRRRLASRLY